jgi:hypothetical protein
LIVCIDSRRRGCLRISGLYTLCINLINIQPLLFTPCSPNIWQLTVQCTVLYPYINGFFQYFSLSNISSHPSQTDLLMQFCFPSHYICMCVYVYEYIHKIHDHICFFIYI